MLRTRVAVLEVESLPDPCRHCLHWEAGGQPGPLVRERARAEARVAKASWWRATELEWGHCGIGVWEGDHLVGYAMVAPATYLDGALRLGRVTQDALLLATLWLDESRPAPEVDKAAGALVEASLQQAAARGAKALEAFASPSGRDPCIPGETRLRDCGFALLRAGFPYPLYRLDLKQTARWRERAEEALVGVARLLRGRRLGRVPSLPSALTDAKQ